MQDNFKIFKDSGYLIVHNLISKDLIDGMYKLYMSDYQDPEKFIYDDDAPMIGPSWVSRRPSYFNATPFTNTQNFFINWFQENMLMRTAPTYNMGRVYTDETKSMFKHTDRTPCEISITMPIAYDTAPWNISIENKDGTNSAVELRVGDVLFYYGCDMPHFRKEDSLNKFHIQHYFHFVDLDSELGSFYNYFRSRRTGGDTWPSNLNDLKQNEQLPIMNMEDKIAYQKLIGEKNV
tara:strand:- start:4978 stop:5682 length:705 start_codon:yes stop_codon:yes gene_type:complete